MLTWDKWQRDFLACKTDKILCSGRQVGKSEVCAADCAEFAANTETNNPILMIAPTERQSYALFDKTLNYLAERYPKLIAMGKDRPTKEKITLKGNHPKILCLPVGQSGTGIRFLTASRLYAEEASRIPEDVWTAITATTMTTGGKHIYLSTPFGCQGTFYKCWINQDGAYNSFKRFSVTSEIVAKERPISESWTEMRREAALNHLKQERARMSKREYAQEYLGEFLDSLFRYFPQELIKKCCTGMRLPYHVGNRYYAGWDLARLGEDLTVGSVIDRTNKNKLLHVEMEIYRKSLTTETEQNIINLDLRFPAKNIYIDAGAGTLGVSIYDHLLDSPVKHKVVAVNNRARSLDLDDKQKTRLLKEDLYSNLLSLMEQGKIILLDDEDVKESLQSVQYEYITGSNGLTKVRIFGNYTHIVESLIRACVCSMDKSLELWAR